MLILRCAGCKQKLWRYKKIGQGAVLRCHKSRINKMYGNMEMEGNKLKCSCGLNLGIDKGKFYKMIAKSFTCSGTKQNG